MEWPRLGSSFVWDCLQGKLNCCLFNLNSTNHYINGIVKKFNLSLLCKHKIFITILLFWNTVRIAYMTNISTHRATRLRSPTSVHTVPWNLRGCKDSGDTKWRTRDRSHCSAMCAEPSSSPIWLWRCICDCTLVNGPTSVSTATKHLSDHLLSM